MHITAAIYVNDNEDGLIEDIGVWLEKLAPRWPGYKHHRTGEDNADAHLKALLLHHETTLPAALAAKLCDGVVSGVSCVLPELMLRAYQEFERDANSHAYLDIKARLEELMQWMEQFPVPWGLKIVAEVRGLQKATFPLPLSAQKRKARHDFLLWLDRSQKQLFCD